MYENIFSLFPTALYTANIDRKFSSSELDFVKTLSQNINNNKENVSSKDKYVIENELFHSLKDFCQLHLNHYYNDVVKPKNDSTIRITQSWLNFSQKGQGHHQHIHANSYLSGVFYINTNPDDNITFLRGYDTPIEIGSSDYNPWNSLSWRVPVDTGMLLIFPSSLLHFVPPVTGDKTRISLSFNSFPVGVIGNGIDATELYI